MWIVDEPLKPLNNWVRGLDSLSLTNCTNDAAFRRNVTSENPKVPNPCGALKRIEMETEMMVLMIIWVLLSADCYMHENFN